MRQWLGVNPVELCINHLLGEHCESHMIAATIKSGGTIDGFIRNNLIEPLSLIERHDQLRQEMKRRWGDRHNPANHKTPLDSIEGLEQYPDWIRFAEINPVLARQDLFKRCRFCKLRSLYLPKYRDNLEQLDKLEV